MTTRSKILHNATGIVSLLWHCLCALVSPCVFIIGTTEATWWHSPSLRMGSSCTVLTLRALWHFTTLLRKTTTSSELCVCTHTHTHRHKRSCSQVQRHRGLIPFVPVWVGNALARGTERAPDALTVSSDSRCLAFIGPSEHVVTIADSRSLDEVPRTLSAPCHLPRCKL